MSERRSRPDQYQLRLPPGLREQLKDAAARNGRSLNAEIVARLEGDLQPDTNGVVGIWLPDDLRERIEQKAKTFPTAPEWLMREALEEAFPYVATYGDQARTLRRRLDQQAKPDPTLARIVEAFEDALRMNPDLDAEPIPRPERGFEMPPEPNE